MLFLTKFSLKNQAAILIICALLIGGGIYSFTSLKTDLLPDIEFPQLSVTIIYPGASTEDVDKQVTKPLEGKLKSIEGLDSMTSQSSESISRIQLSFPLDSDMDNVNQKVNELITEARLPENTIPRVTRFSFGTFPIINLALFPKGNEDIEIWANDVLRPELLKINGINTVGFSGISQQYLEIVVNKSKAAQNGVNLNQIKEAIQSSYFSFPAGTVRSEAVLIPVRIDQKIEQIEELKSIKLTSPIEGAPAVTIGDIADVKEINEKSELTRYNLEDAISMSVSKKQDSNTVEVADQVYKILNSYSNKIEYVLSFDQASGVKSSISELINKGLFGALVASFAVLLFLRNFRATLIAILSIPLSLLIASIFLKWLGITLNVMSLAGMAVAVGRVVDDSIIVIENIYRKVRLQPDGNRDELTLEGTKEMMNAILSSTITSIVVFLPLGLVGGITGAFFMPFAITIVIALLASLLVAITLVPLLARFSFNSIKIEQEKEPLYVKWYSSLVLKALNHKLITISLAFVVLVVSFIPLATGQLGFVFLPNEKQKLLIANMDLPASTTLESTNDISLQIEAKLLESAAKYPKVFSAVGAYDFQTASSRTNNAQYIIELGDEVDVDTALVDVQKMLESIVQGNFPTGTVSVQELAGGGPPANNNIDINLYTDDLSKLAEAAKMVEDVLLAQTDLKYIKNNMEEKQQQWTVQLDPFKMKDLGVSPFMVLGLIADQTRPVDVGRYELGGQTQQIKIVYDKPLQGKNELEELKVFTKEGPKSLKDIAVVSDIEVVTTLQKLNERSYAKVSAQVVGNDIRAVSNAVKEQVALLKLPDGVTTEAGGGSDETIQTFIDLLIAMVIAIGLVYLTMLIFFGKARLPFVILTSLLFVPIGSVIGLYIAKEPLSMSAMIGLLMLIGIVVTNAIVLVDRINQNRNNGMDVRKSLIEAGKTRLRPILMTALATIGALLPLAFSTPEGGLISRGLALVVIGGLTTSTLLTVVFLPVIYELAFFKQYRKEMAGGLK